MTRALHVALLCTLLGACDHGPAQPDGRYHGRGVIAAISGSGADAELSIHHEAIPHFKDRDGREATMASMTMIFGLAPSASAADFRVGDEVSFDFDLRWSISPALLITKLEKLPPDTPLRLSSQ